MNNIDTKGIIKLFENIQLFDIQEDSSIHFLEDIEISSENELAVLCVQAEKPELLENEQQQLSRILTYLKKSLEDTPVILCTRKNPVQFQQLKRTVPFKKLIIFGGNRKLLGLHIDKGSGYQPVHIDNKVFFFSYDLASLEADAKKKQLLKMALDALVAIQ